MPISNPESLNFGLSAIRLKRNDVLVGQDSLVGNVTAEWNTGTVSTMSAAASYPSYYRNAGSEGAGTITLQDRPVWIDGDVAGGNVTRTAAASAASVGSITSTIGTSINGTDFTVAASSSNPPTNAFDFHIEATSSSMLRIRYVSDRGEQDIENVAVSATATPIGDTGVTITGPASPSLNIGDAGEFSVDPPHGGKTDISIPQFRTGRYYHLTIWGAEGGADDSPERIIMPRVYIVGCNLSKTAKEMPQVEIPFNLCAPLDGSDAVQRTIWQPAE